MAIKNGFCLACSTGPLANEQLMGVIFILEKIEAVEETKPEKPEGKEKEEEPEKSE